MHRYIVLAWNPEESESSRVAGSIQSRLASPLSKWITAYQDTGVFVSHTGSEGGAPDYYSLANSGGVILGTLFRRGCDNTTSETINFGADETDALIQSCGQHVVDNYWGTYVAILRDRQQGACHVFRDPTATLCCYYTNFHRINIFFSDINDCIRFVPVSFSVNRTQLITHLIFYQNYVRACGLNEIEDIPGGECLTLSKDSITRTVLWHPAKFCDRGLPNSADLENEACAADLLRSTVQASVSALASSHSNIVLRLSGGLDSSIVAGCLARAPSKPHVTCLNFFMDSGTQDAPAFIPTLSKSNLAKFHRTSGHFDEREFARLVTTRHGFPSVEWERRVDRFDLREIWQSPLAPRPTTYALGIDMDGVESQVAQSRNASAFFSGFAGDTVFYCTQQPFSAVDYAYSHPFGPRLFQEVFAATALSRESMWAVLSKVVRHGFLGRPMRMPSPYDVLKGPHLLNYDAVAAMTKEDALHPWISLAGHLPPGKENHVIGAALSILFYSFVFHSERYATSVNPLAAQPVVELCLQIPSYILLAGGVSRGLARRAFADRLPPEIQRRTVKGLAVSFWRDLVLHNMGFIRESLLDGLLAREGLLDRPRLAAYLIKDQPFLTVQPIQLLIYLACEAWLRQWADIRQRAVA